MFGYDSLQRPQGLERALHGLSRFPDHHDGGVRSGRHVGRSSRKLGILGKKRTGIRRSWFRSIAASYCVATLAISPTLNPAPLTILATPELSSTSVISTVPIWLLMRRRTLPVAGS